MIVYKATIEIAVIADSQAEACDGMSVMLSENDFVFDWSYLAFQGLDPYDQAQVIYKSPEPICVDEDRYEEGDLFVLH